MFKYIQYIIENNYIDLLKYPNVVGVGCGYKVIKDIRTQIPTIGVFVSSKYSKELLGQDNIIPTVYKGVATDVVHTGHFDYFGFTQKVRPMQFGYSIGRTGILNILDGGTAGCMVRDKKDPNIKYILSNNHVLADNNPESIGKAILQPAREEAFLSASEVATVSRYIPIITKNGNFVPENLVDCAIARLKDNNIAIPNIVTVGIPTGIAQPILHESVKKVGSSSGLTTGEILYTDAVVDITTRKSFFTKQIITTRMAGRGDSGAVLLNMDNKILGLLMSGTPETTTYNYIGEVLDALQVTVVTTPN